MGLITIRATPGPVVCEDVRQELDQPIGWEITSWFERQAWLEANDDEQLLAMRLRAADDLVLTTDAVAGPDGWSSTNWRLRATRGMRWEVESDEAISGLVGALDGSVELAVPIGLLAAAYGLTPAEGARAVLPVVRDLLARGLVRLA
jgi:hypothetical protein